MRSAFSYVGLSRSSLPADWQFVYDPVNPGLEPTPRDYAYSIPGLTVFGNAAFSSHNVLVGTAVHELQHGFDYQEANADVIYGYPQWDALTTQQTKEAIHAVLEFRALTTELEFIKQRGGYPASDRNFVIDRQQYWRNQVQNFTSPEAVLSNPPRLRRR